MTEGDTMEQVRVGSRAGRGSRTLRALGALGVVSVLVLAACGSSDSGSDGSKASSKGSTTTTKAGGDSKPDAKGSPATTKDLDGNTYVGSSIDGYAPVAGSQLTMTFDDGNLAVNAGCNTMTAAYEVEDGKLSWTDAPAATMMACSDELMSQDHWLTELLTKGVDASVSGKDLVLGSGKVTITLTEQSTADLVGTKWTLESTVTKDAVSSHAMPNGPATLMIAKDGTATVFTGCNNGTTSVEITDTTLTFAPLALTRMMCQDVADVENTITTVLDGETTYTIDGNTLTITNGDNGLVYTATA